MSTQMLFIPFVFHSGDARTQAVKERNVKWENALRPESLPCAANVIRSTYDVPLVGGNGSGQIDEKQRGHNQKTIVGANCVNLARAWQRAKTPR